MTELEKRREYKRKWRLENKEHCKQYAREKRLENEFSPDHIISSMWTSAKKRSKKRGHEFAISKEYLYKLVVETNGFCELSGLPLSAAFNDPMKLSLDRIDSSVGYVPSNIQIVATCVNNAKNDLDQAAFIKICKAIAKRNK